MILRIVANNVVAAVILNDNGIVWEAAPILRYMRAGTASACCPAAA